MTWTAPEVDRPEPIDVGDERSMLQSFLDFHRQTLLFKCQGLDADRLKRRSTEPSAMSLLGLVRHLTDVERVWFRRRVLGEPIAPIHFTDTNLNGDFDDVADADPERDLALYRTELETCDKLVADLPLDHTFVNPRTGRTHTLRWVYLHLIEEYARHNGHADLLRERIDGTVGE
ncbi:DinB family protein [Nocardia transvalensis]|uniref:DinB family protein n=1 Tax=Nocardia transvalensis TaxID=37333 RepID=UPI0018932B54|nr:DinB family protein [Nocardia transvalensis]MBF6331590.1 DinB family protein [Nocardia transvalensis]